MSSVILCFTVLLTHKATCQARRINFMELVKSSELFVDKTMMIRDFLEDPAPVKVITAPSHFGKSTVIDMIKRFTEIKFDVRGNRLKWNFTEDYRLFCDPPLNICADKEFVANNFGQYPVIHIDYKPLKKVNNFKKLQRLFRFVVSETYNEHKYLVHYTQLFTSQDELALVDRYFRKPIRRIRKTDLLVAFKKLTRLLHSHYGKKVIVLMDNYDSLCRIQLLKSIGHLNDMVGFLEYVTTDLFKDNPHLENAIITGILRVKDVGVRSLKDGFREYRFLGNHRFSRYFGLTNDELDGFLSRIDTSDEDVIRTKKELTRMYSGYAIENQNTTVSSMWSITRFLADEEVSEYWANKQHLRYLIHIFNADISVKMIKHLLYDESFVFSDISDGVSQEMVRTLGNFHASTPTDDKQQCWLLSYLYDHGFLTTAGNPVKQRLPLRIPNDEISMEFLITLHRYFEYNKCYHTPIDLIRLSEAMRLKGSLGGGVITNLTGCL